MAANMALIKERLEHGAQKKIAESIGVPAPTVSNVITGAYRPRTERGRKTERRVQVAIARALRMKVEEVFPSVAA
jgi:DNA-binding transcriptional regulator YdaS (Cro superfamily)